MTCRQSCPFIARKSALELWNDPDLQPNEPYAIKTDPADANSVGAAAAAQAPFEYQVSNGTVERAFSDCTSLATVTIPNSVTGIGLGSFSGCASLTSVTIPNSVTGIEYATFSGCTSLASVIIPNSVTRIEERAFSGCTSLASVTIPNSVTHIGDSAFFNCTRLTRIYFEGNVPSTGADIFRLTPATVYYLPGTMGWGTTFGYRPTAPWQPQIQAGDATFGLQTNRFGFAMTWARDKVVVVEACTDLDNPGWASVATNTLAGGSSYFSDPQWSNHPRRFYRLVSQELSGVSQ